MQKIGLMFVCLGNICRSPLAEAIFITKITNQNLLNNFNIASSGTSNYHVNEKADRRTIQIAEKHKLHFNHRAQQLNQQHFSVYDYIIAMDDSNLLNIEKIKPKDTKCILFKMGSFNVEHINSDVADPYYGDISHFEECYNTLDEACDELLRFLKAKHSI